MLGSILRWLLEIVATGVDFLCWLVILSFPVLWVYIIVTERRDARREAEMLKFGREFQVGDGVTLIEGIRAYYGEDGRWGVWDDEVRMRVGRPSIMIRIKFEPIGKGADRLSPRIQDDAGHDLSEEEMEAVFRRLTEAAMRKRSDPKT